MQVQVTAGPVLNANSQGHVAGYVAQLCTARSCARRSPPEQIKVSRRVDQTLSEWVTDDGRESDQRQQPRFFDLL
jgi:hypothetical protein